jgi:hypothetical protein
MNGLGPKKGEMVKKDAVSDSGKMTAGNMPKSLK